MCELCKLGAVKDYADIQGVTPRAIANIEKQRKVMRFFRKGSVVRKGPLWLRSLGSVDGCSGDRCAVIIVVADACEVMVFKRYA